MEGGAFIKVRLLTALAVALIVFAAVAVPRPARADASPTLLQALGSLRDLSDASFGSVVTWARNGAPAVSPFPTRDYEYVQQRIQNLGSDDRSAVLSWLTGNGRSSLYAQGATDAQIGSRDPSASPAPTSSPSVWRNVPLASESLDEAASQGHITILNGFIGAKRDGTALIACAGFRNDGPVAATRVVIVFPLSDANGRTVGRLTLDRRGTFSQGVGIMTYPSFEDWSNGIINRGYADNCVQRNLNMPAMPVLEAQYAWYRVTHVEYADGTAWPH